MRSVNFCSVFPYFLRRHLQTLQSLKAEQPAVCQSTGGPSSLCEELLLLLFFLSLCERSVT